MNFTVFNTPNREPSQNPPLMTQNDLDFEDALNETNQSGSTGPMVLCPCNKTDIDEKSPLLTCNYCGSTSHGPCYGITSVLEHHCCVRCSDSNPELTPTDDRLATLTAKKRECLCIFRRALWLLGLVEQVSATTLAEKFALTQLNVCKLMKLLHSHGVLVSGDDDDLVTPRKIIRDQLKQVMSKFFHNEETNIVDRLLAETLSQENHPDPVGDVLAPMEKVSLQNATTIAKIVEPTPPNSNPEDYTLKQYREAILSNETIEEDLPLSGNHNPVKDFEKIGKKSNTVKRKMEDQEVKLKTGVRTKRARTAKKHEDFV